MRRFLSEFVWSLIAVVGLGVLFTNVYQLLFSATGGWDNIVYIVLSILVTAVALMMDGRD